MAVAMSFTVMGIGGILNVAWASRPWGLGSWAGRPCYGSSDQLLHNVTVDISEAEVAAFETVS